MLISWGEFFPGLDADDSQGRGPVGGGPSARRRPSCARPPTPASARSRISATRAARSSACRNTRRTWTPPGSSCSGPARKDVMTRCTLGGGASPDAHLVLRRSARQGGGQGRPRHHAPLPAIEWTIDNVMGSEPDMPPWAGFSNNEIPVELGKLLTGQDSSPQECMDAIKSKADELAAPFREAGSASLAGQATDGPGPRHRQQHDRDQGDRLGPFGPRRRRGPAPPCRCTISAAAGWSRASRTGGDRSATRCAISSAQVDPARVAALAISNQRETVGFLDEAGAEVRPAILWLDERCRPDIDLFGRQAAGASGSAPSPARRPTRRRPCSACTGCSAASPSIGAARRISSTCWAISAGA